MKGLGNNKSWSCGGALVAVRRLWSRRQVRPATGGHRTLFEEQERKGHASAIILDSLRRGGWSPDICRSRTLRVEPAAGAARAICVLSAGSDAGRFVGRDRTGAGHAGKRVDHWRFFLPGTQSGLWATRLAGTHIDD